MKNTVRTFWFFLLVALTVCAAAPVSRANAAGVRSGVDWADFLARQDLVWNTLPKQWEGGAFTGNGLLGAMIYSEGAHFLQWDVGRSDVTDRGDRIAIGRFVLTPGHPATGATMRLDLWNAEARGRFTTADGETRWRSFTHASNLVNVIELTEPAGAALAKLNFEHLSADSARDAYQKIEVPADEHNPDPAYGETDGVQWCRQPFVDGGGYVVAWTEKQTAPGHRVFYFTVDYFAKTDPETGRAVATVQAASQTALDDLVATHRAWWHDYYPESFLSIPDARMESFYWIQMYKFASGTRADRPALDLMGPWFRRTPWPHLWWNLNIQLTYWPVYAANRLELGESLTRMIDTNRQNLINNVPKDWRDDSAGIGRSSPYDCVRSIPDGSRVSERGDLTWALHNYWLQYRYSGDETLLRDGLYPILKRAIGYYLHLLTPGADGKLHLPVSISPEFPKNAPDTGYDLSLLRWGLQTLLAANDRLQLNDPLAAKWRDTLADLTPNPVDPKTGYMIGAGQPLDESHRHFSHLLLVYPLHLVDSQSPADRPLIEQSLDHWQSMPSKLRGYSYTGASAMSAWLGRRDAAVRLLNQFLDSFVKPNTMYTEAGPVIETPLSCAASIHEIVLQSWSQETFGTHIRVFPAVPDAWRDVSFDKLRAEGAFEVSAVRRDGRTRFVSIKSLAGAPCRVSTSLPGKIMATGAREFQVTTELEDGQPVTVVDLKKGETVLLTSADAAPATDESVIEPVSQPAAQWNYYGSPKTGGDTGK